jgi:glycosyltransferase involved in cell wall biosynthesis
MAGIPSINNVTGLGTVFIRQNLTSRIAEMLYRFTFRFPHTVFFQNEDDRQLFLDKKLVKEEITEVLPGSGIDIQRFKAKLPFSKKTQFTFLMIGRLLYDKGILEYIEAIRLMRKKGLKARFQVLGKLEPNKNLGITADQIEEWVKDGLVEYLGCVEDVCPLIEQADCVILPSYREGTPRTLLEAASLGKPIIATDVPGCRETVDDGLNGFLCKVKDPVDLAAKMTQMMNLNENSLRRMGTHSRNLAVTKFDQNIVIRKYQTAVGSLQKNSLPEVQVAPALQMVRVN